MVLSLIEHGDFIYTGTCQDKLNNIVSLFHRGLRICDIWNNKVPKNITCYA